MVAWVALIVSIISLAVNIIVQRDKLTTFFDDLSKWQQPPPNSKVRNLGEEVARAEERVPATGDRAFGGWED